MTVQFASPQDLPIIAALAHSIWPDAYKEILSKEQLTYMLNKFYSKESLEKQLNDLQHQFIIAYENEEPIGFASFSNVEPKRYRLHKLYISTSLQHKGIGKEILITIFKAIASTEPVVMELNVNRQNTAIAFYKKMGFTIVKEEDIDIGNGYFMNDYVMEVVI